MNNVQNDAILFGWADIETGGLDGKREDDDTLGMETYPILEIAMHITDSDLNILDGEGFRVVIHHPDSVFRPNEFVEHQTTYRNRFVG